jgi:two-component system, sensor histidine kinase
MGAETVGRGRKYRLEGTFRLLYFPPAAADNFSMKMNRSTAAKLVVVIDDDPLVLEATNELLSSWGCQVICAQSFDEALNQLVKIRRRPDLIVCDYRLSEGETGVDVIAGLRNAFEIPALLISGDSSAPESEDAHDSYQLLRKPVNAQVLRQALVGACVLQN